MSLKIKKNTLLIDQHDKNFMYGGKFGGNFIPETLKKPIDDLTKLFTKLRKDKKFLKERDHYFTSYVGAPTPFIKLENLSDNLGGAQIYAKVVSEANGGAHKIYNATVHCLIAKKAGKKYALAGSVSKYNIENINNLGVNFCDLSSSLENQLGYKDHLKIRNFMDKFNELKN